MLILFYLNNSIHSFNWMAHVSLWSNWRCRIFVCFMFILLKLYRSLTSVYCLMIRLSKLGLHNYYSANSRASHSYIYFWYCGTSPFRRRDISVRKERGFKREISCFLYKSQIRLALLSWEYRASADVTPDLEPEECFCSVDDCWAGVIWFWRPSRTKQ